jgi:hypothetical protein
MGRVGGVGAEGRTRFPHYLGGHKIDYVHRDRLDFWRSIITFDKENQGNDLESNM